MILNLGVKVKGLDSVHGGRQLCRQWLCCLELGIRIQDQGFQSIAKSQKVIHSFDPHHCET